MGKTVGVDDLIIISLMNGKNCCGYSLVIIVSSGATAAEMLYYILPNYYIKSNHGMSTPYIIIFTWKFIKKNVFTYTSSIFHNNNIILSIVSVYYSSAWVHIL